MAIHMGSGFFGVPLPDFGISERIGSVLNRPQTSQGGSNIFGGQQAYVAPPQPQVPQPSTNNYSPGNYNYPQPQGSVLGTSTGSSYGSRGTSGLFTPQAQPLQPQQQAPQSDGGYGEYLKSLDDQIMGLNDQRASQEQIANNSYNQGLNTVQSQYNQGQKDLSASREKTLKDLAQNLRQSFQSGNTYLGARGASDSSAANQYAYALTKLGNQQRGDVQSQYDQSLFKLKNTYDTETKNLELDKNNKLQQISQWFAEAQNQLKGQKGQVALQQSQQALSIAMQMAQQVQQQVQSQRSALDQWAANHATSFQGLQNQLQQNAQFTAQIPAFQGIQGGGPAQAMGAATGYGTGSDKDLFGNPIR